MYTRTNLGLRVPHDLRAAQSRPNAQMYECIWSIHVRSETSINGDSRGGLTEHVYRTPRSSRSSISFFPHGPPLSASIPGRKQPTAARSYCPDISNHGEQCTPSVLNSISVQVRRWGRSREGGSPREQTNPQCIGSTLATKKLLVRGHQLGPGQGSPRGSQ